jgi:hypothetical protein
VHVRIPGARPARRLLTLDHRMAMPSFRATSSLRSSRSASRAIHRALVLSSRSRPVASSTAAAWSSAFRLPICRSDQFTAFLHHGALVGRRHPDPREPRREVRVGAIVFVHSLCGDERERRATHVREPPAAPCARRRVGRSRVAEQVVAELVTEIPRVHVAHPCVHLPAADELGIVHHRSKDACLVDARVPQVERERVVASVLPRDAAQLRDRDPDRSVDGDAHPRHALCAGRIGHRPHGCDHGGDGRTHAPYGAAPDGSTAQARRPSSRPRVLRRRATAAYAASVMPGIDAARAASGPPPGRRPSTGGTAAPADHTRPSPVTRCHDRGRRLMGTGASRPAASADRSVTNRNARRRSQVRSRSADHLQKPQSSS